MGETNNQGTKLGFSFLILATKTSYELFLHRLVLQKLYFVEYVQLIPSMCVYVAWTWDINLTTTYIYSLSF